MQDKARITMALNEGLEVDRRLGEYIGSAPGPTVVALGGVHGNEPSGVHAICEVLSTLQRNRIRFKGNFFGLAGNLKALQLGIRFIDADLNRLWESSLLSGDQGRELAEYEELHALKEELTRIAGIAEGPIILLDLHSFSGDGPPFVISDEAAVFEAVLRGLPFPVILGMIDKVRGTLNHFMRALGHLGMAVEGGQHDDPQTIPNQALFLWLFLLKKGHIHEVDAPPDIDHSWVRLMETTGHLPRRVRVNYRHEIHPGDAFKMFPGFQCFSPVRKDEPLATDRYGIIYSLRDGCILMPLYQGQGNDGFFIGQQEIF